MFQWYIILNFSQSFSLFLSENKSLILGSLLEWPLQLFHEVAQHPKHLSKSKTPAPDTDSVDEKVHQRPVGDAEGKEDAEIY